MREDYKIRLGQYGETLAARFLERHGWRVTSRNFHTRFGEIDLIAEKPDEILFCEVKTRTSDDYGYPETAVDYFKVRRLMKAIGFYSQARRINKFWRLDIVSVEINRENKTAKFNWFKNIGEN